MVAEVVVRIPDAEPGDDMNHVHDAAKRLSEMTASGNVELRESKTFQPVNDDGEGGNNWKTYVIEAACLEKRFDAEAVRNVHKDLVRNISVPSEVAIETRVASENMHLVG